AAVLNDIVGWIILAIVASLATGAALTFGGVTGTLLNTVGFLAVSFALGRLFIRRLFQWLQREFPGDFLFSVVIVLMLGWAAVSSWLDLEPILGAFVMGAI